MDIYNRYLLIPLILSDLRLSNSAVIRIKVDKNEYFLKKNNLKKILNNKKNFDGLLSGVPLAIKDLFCTKNVKTTAGSKILENFS